ncbi:MAG: hypothetical protein HY925_09770, partial [Elusimicrobia bacterium]|nr:hypothetical protein [Elusimicrobiota bacterium]
MPRVLLRVVLAVLPAFASAQVNVPVEVRPLPAPAIPFVAPAVPLPSLQSIQGASVLPPATLRPVPMAGRAVLVPGHAPKASALASAAAPARPLRMAIPGPPGSGKGTYAKRLE